MPSRVQAGSLTSLVAALEVNECTSKVERVQSDLTLTDFAVKGSEIKEELRNRVAPSVAAAKSKTGGTYSIELGFLNTTSHVIYVVAVITRLG